MPATPVARGLRLSARSALAIWLVWLGAVVVLSLLPWQRHLEYARQGHASIFWIFAGFVAAVPLAAAAYQNLRSPGLRKIEPYVLAGAAAGIPLVWEPLATLWIGWLFVSSYAIGRTVIARFSLVADSAPVRLLFSFAAGFGVLACPLALLGHFQLYRAGPLAALLAVSTAVGWRYLPELVRTPRLLFRQWATAPDLGRLPSALVVVLAAVLIASGLAVSLAPSIAFDPLRFHLPLARHYAETGGLDVLAPDGYGYNPQNFELLLALGWTVAGQPASQLIAPAFGLLFWLGLLLTGRRMGLSRSAAALGAVLTMALPYVHWAAANVKHDLIVAFLQLTGLLAWFEWRRTRSIGWIYLGTFFAATSFGFKHPAAFGIAGLVPLYVYAACQHPRRWRPFVICALIFMLFGTLWQVRSAVLTGDPFYYYNLDQPLPGDHAEQVGSVANRLKTALTWPWLIHFDGQLFFRSDTSNPVGFVLLFFAPVWILWRERLAPEARAALLFAGVALGLWCAYVPLLRFVIAPLSILVMLTMQRVHSWHESAGPGARLSLRLATAWSVAFALCVILILEVNAPQVRYFTRQTDKQGYLSEALRTYAPLAFLTGVARPGDLVLGLQNCSMAYAPDPDTFHCRLYETYDVSRISGIESLPVAHFQWVVCPSQADWLAFVRRRAGALEVETVYTGANYSVLRLVRPE